MFHKMLYLLSFVLVLELVAQASDPNIVGLWKFDESSDTTAYDSSDNNNHGTIYGGASLNGSGQLTLDGSDDYVSLPIGSVIASLTNCTFEAWVDFSNEGGAWQRIFDFGNNTSVNMFLTPRTDTSGPLRFAITTSGSGAEQQATAAETLPSGLHRVIVTIDADNHTIRMYVDSALVAQNTNATLTPSDLGNTVNNWLGRSQYSWDAYFKGSFDEFCIYNYVLPQSKIIGPLAYGPNPADKAENVHSSVVLSWSQGCCATLHDVYFGIDFNDVNDANNSLPVGSSVYKGNQPLSDCDYDPGVLESGQTYYWRIDEVNGTTIWKGSVWSFTIFDYAIDDFEDYTSSADLNDTWVPSGRASVSLSTDIYHKGTQAMRIDYNNIVEPHYSQVSRTYDSSQDWTVCGIRTLAIHFRGQVSNGAEKMHLIIEDDDWGTSTAAVEYDGDPNNLKKDYWQRWDIDLQQFVDENPVFRLENVKKISIAIGDPENPSVGCTGAVYFDDIGLHISRCIAKNQPMADFNGDCFVEFNDLKIMANEWLDSGAVKADPYDDNKVDFKDYTIFADKWLDDYEDWPKLVDPDKFLTAVPFYDVNIAGGLWGQRIATDRDVTIPHCWNKCETTTGRLDNFLNAINHTGTHTGYVFNDTDIYKTLEATGYSLRLFPDSNLEDYADSIIDIIEAVQWEDGYLDTLYSIPWPQPELRWTNIASNHELYCAGHLFEGAIAYYQATSKSKILDVAIRFADHIDTVFGPGKNMHPPGHQEIEVGLIKLYQLTKDVRYFDLTKFFLDQRGNAAGHSLYGEYSQDHLPIIEQDEAVGHAVRAGYMYSGMLDVALINSDEAYALALNRIWDNVVAKKVYLTGGIGAGMGYEGFGPNYFLPNDSYCETCASIANAMWNHRMFLLHGDGKYLDVMERTMLNGVLSGISLSGNRFFYTNPLESGGGTRSDWFGCACCPPNLARFIMSAGGKAYAYKKDAVYVNMYINGSAEVSMPGNTVNLSVDTNYPWDGNIQITVNPDHSDKFGIYLRIPCWAQNRPMPGNLYKYQNESSEQVTLSVNSLTTDVDIKRGFVSIERTWNSGDVIELHLPMPVRRVVAHPNVAADVGKVAIERGPIVYCAEGVDNGGSVGNLYVPDALELGAAYEPGTLNGVVVIRGEDPDIVLIPYYAWANRGATAMTVWLPRE